MELSVIIPTYNRGYVLTRCLEALYAQRGVQEPWEIVVVDDGSTDDTQARLELASAQAPLPLRSLRQMNCGPAAARNLAVRTARGRLVLFIGDDILAAPDLVAAHLMAHRHHSEPGTAMLGRVIWAPSMRVTPFLRWWDNYRFRFNKLDAGIKPDFTYFYTCNTSVQREFLLEHGLFDESFKVAAFEDTELAYRLQRHGLNVLYIPEACAVHEHPMDFGMALRQMEQNGRWVSLFRARTGYRGIPKLWDWLGHWPVTTWPIAAVSGWLCALLQDLACVPPLAIPALMYHFRVGQRQVPQKPVHES